MLKCAAHGGPVLLVRRSGSASTEDFKPAKLTSVDATLTPPRAPYRVTLGKLEERKRLSCAGFANLCSTHFLPYKEEVAGSMRHRHLEKAPPAGKMQHKENAPRHTGAFVQ